MKVVAAYLLALLGGNASPSAKDIEAILGSGAEHLWIFWSLTSSVLLEWAVSFLCRKDSLRVSGFSFAVDLVLFSERFVG